MNKCFHTASCTRLGEVGRSKARCGEQPLRFCWKISKQAVLSCAAAAHSSFLDFYPHLKNKYVKKNTPRRKHLKMGSNASVLKSRKMVNITNRGSFEFVLHGPFYSASSYFVPVDDGSSPFIIGRHQDT